MVPGGWFNLGIDEAARECWVVGQHGAIGVGGI
jgi:hypothetical protein